MSDDEQAKEEPSAEAAAGEEAAVEEGAEDTDGAADPEAVESGGLVSTLRDKLKIIIAGVMTLAIIGGGVYGFMSGAGEAISNSLSGTPIATLKLPGVTVFHELPLMTVDLKPSKVRKRPFIRFIMTIELEEKDLPTLIARQVQVLDAAQTFLRTQTVKDLTGDAGTKKLRVKMTDILNIAISPSRISAVLFKEILVR